MPEGKSTIEEPAESPEDLGLDPADCNMDADPFNADWSKMSWDISVKEPRAVARAIRSIGWPLGKFFTMPCYVLARKHDPGMDRIFDEAIRILKDRGETDPVLSLDLQVAPWSPPEQLDQAVARAEALLAATEPEVGRLSLQSYMSEVRRWRSS